MGGLKISLLVFSDSPSPPNTRQKLILNNKRILAKSIKKKTFKTKLKTNPLSN